MEKAEKLQVAQNYIDGMNTLTIRFAPYGIDKNTGKYIKKPDGERYFSSSELKYIKKIHDDINDGLKLKLNEDQQEVTDFDGAQNGKPIKTKAKEKMKEKYPDESDMDDIVDVYFLTENKDKVGDKAKKVK